MIENLLKRNRSIRRFEQSPKPSVNELEKWVANLRFTASARNAQPLKYMIITEQELCHRLCAQVGWAGYLKDWSGPQRDEEPTAYIIQLLDKTLSPKARFDEGLQLEALTLQACEAGFGSCIILAFAQKEVKDLLSLGADFEVLSIVAIGSPKEEVVITDLEEGSNSIAYYRDEDGRHYVPKRKAEALIYQVLK